MTLPLRCSFLAMSLLCAGILVGASTAQATTMDARNRELSVTYRADPSFTTDGIPFGRFILHPSLTTVGKYTDNLYSVQANKEEDYILTLSPHILLESDFDRHSLNLFLGGTQALHKNNNAENYLEYNLGTDTRYDLTEEFSIPTSLSYARDTSRRDSPDDQDGLEPTEFDVLRISSGLHYIGTVLQGGVSLKAEDYSYKNTPTATSIRNNHDRNRLETTASVNLGIGNRAGIMPYLFTSYKDISYEDRLDDAGFNRSAKELQGGLGARFQLSALTHSLVQVGYASYDFDDARFSRINDITALANITWEPSTLLALSLTGERKVAQTTLTNLSASVDSSLKLGATYELTPSVFLYPNVSYLKKDYDGIATDAVLEQESAGLNINYKMNKNLWWSAQYEYITQSDPKDSPLIGEFDRNDFLISLRVKL